MLLSERLSRVHVKNMLLASSAGIALLLGSPATYAQAAPGPVQGSSAQPDELTEIIVTARRTAEAAQTVPVSLQAFDAKVLADKGIVSTTDLQKFVPGVVLNGVGTDLNTTYSIRGQGRVLIGSGLPSVVNYFNEVPLSSWANVLPAFDVSNIQVLKGPQGTLFGRNTTGGAVLAYSTPPDFRFGGYIQGDFGNYSEHSGQGAINLPIIDQKLAVRIAFDIERRDGYSHNITTGGVKDDVNSDAVRVSVLATPLDWLKNTVVFDFSKTDQAGPGTAPIAAANPLEAAVVAATQAQGRYAFGSIVNGFERAHIWGVSNTTVLDFDAVTFKNIFGVRSTDVNAELASAAGVAVAPIPIAIPSLGLALGTPGVLLDTVARRNDRQISDEIQFTGMAFGNSLNWLVGAFFLDDEPTGPNTALQDLYRPTSPSPTTSFIVNDFLGGIWPIGSFADTLYTDKSHAVFGNASYDLSRVSDLLHGFKLNGGVRYTWDKEGVCANARTSTLLSTGPSVTGQNVAQPYDSLKECRADPGGFVNSPANAYGPSYSNSASFSAPTYTAGIDYELNDNAFFYFTTRRAYRAGGLNSPNMAPILAPFQTFGPQTLTDYEIGTHLKARFGDWITRFNIDAFTGKYNKLQLLASGIFAGTLPGVTAANAPSNSSVILNAGSATIQGVEFDGLVSPFRGLDFSVAGAYLNPRYDNLTVPSFLSPFFNTGPFAGAPRWSYSADLRYKLPVPNGVGSFFVDFNHYHIAKEYQGFLLLPAYDLDSLSVQWANVFQRPLDLTFYMDNAFNTRYIHNSNLSVPNVGIYSGSYGPPRMFGVRLRYTFGPRE